MLFTEQVSLKVVMASDIHLGTIISHGRLKRIVDAVNSLEPDVILLPGDILDEDLGPVVRHNLGELLRTLRAKYGVFGATGNHEYIGGVEPACRYLQEHGIRMLRDSAVTLPNGVTVVGREDRSIRQFSGNSRKTLAEILSGVDPNLPVILMDHHPAGLGEAAEAGIDLQISGHTHHGQLWPFNYISIPSDAAYDIAVYSEFADEKDLAIYIMHPEHVKVAEFVGKVRESRVVVDYLV